MRRSTATEKGAEKSRESPFRKHHWDTTEIAVLLVDHVIRLYLQVRLVFFSAAAAAAAIHRFPPFKYTHEGKKVQSV